MVLKFPHYIINRFLQEGITTHSKDHNHFKQAREGVENKENRKMDTKLSITTFTLFLFLASYVSAQTNGFDVTKYGALPNRDITKVRSHEVHKF